MHREKWAKTLVSLSLSMRINLPLLLAFFKPERYDDDDASFLPSFLSTAQSSTGNYVSSGKELKL